MVQGSLAHKLRVLRAERGLSLRQAAAMSGVAKETIGDIEHGARRPHDMTVGKLARAYNVPVEQLLEEPVPLDEATGRGLPITVEELLARRNTKTRHLADPNLVSTLADTSRPLEDVVRIVREATEELKAIAPDVVRLRQLARLGQLPNNLFDEVSRQALITKLALPARLGQKFVPIGLEASAEEALPELTPEQRAEINEAMRKLAEA